MIDQATELRNLVLRAARAQPVTQGPPPRLILATGGKPGVGTTTLAVNLSVALADLGLRVVLVDADLEQADVASLCGLAVPSDLGDILASRRDIHEVLARGPAGLQVVPGLKSRPDGGEYSDTTLRRLLGQIRSLGRHADLVVVDVGGGPNSLRREFWQLATEVLVATTPDPLSVMDAYANLKMHHRLGDSGPSAGLIVNQAGAEADALEVYRRMDHSCRRFLGYGVGWIGCVPLDPQVAQAAAAGTPMVLHQPASAAARSYVQLAQVLMTSDKRRRVVA